MDKPTYAQIITEYNDGYYAWIYNNPYDESKSQYWKEGYEDAKKENPKDEVNA